MYWYDSVKLSGFESAVSKTGQLDRKGERVHATVSKQMEESWIYCAPEVLRNQTFTQECDVWSVGVVAATLLIGK